MVIPVTTLQVEPTAETLLAEIRTYQRRLPDGEQKLVAAIGIRDSSTWLKRRAEWDRLLGAYQWSVSELRELGIEEPTL